MALYETEAIVINAARMGEADLLVTMFTRDFGKIKAVARGARILKSRYCGLFGLLSAHRVIYLGNERQGLYRMTQCDPIAVHDLGDSLERMMTACCMAEALELCCGPGEADAPLYNLSLEAIVLLHGGGQGHNLGLSFVVKAFSLSGYQPHLKDCIVCGKALKGDRLRFSPARGGVVCGRCGVGAGVQAPLSMGCLNYLRAALGLDLRRSSRIKLNSGLRKEARNIIYNHVAYNVGKELKTLRFLEM